MRFPCPWYHPKCILTVDFSARASVMLILTVNSAGLQLLRRHFLCKHEELQSNLQHACTMQNMTAQACTLNAGVRNRPVRVFVGLSAKAVSFIFNERSYLKGIRWRGRKEDTQQPFQASACSYMTVCAGSLVCITTHTLHALQTFGNRQMTCYFFFFNKKICFHYF